MYFQNQCINYWAQGDVQGNRNNVIWENGIWNTTVVLLYYRLIYNFNSQLKQTFLKAVCKKQAPSQIF